MASFPRHKLTITMFRTLIGLLCLGFLSFGMAYDHDPEVISVHAGHIAHSDTASSAAKHTGFTRNAATSHSHLIEEEVGSSSTSSGKQHATGDHNKNCEPQCGHTSDCPSVCALACASGVTSISFVRVAAEKIPTLCVSLPTLQDTGLFFGFVPSPLYRPPIHLI